MIDGIKILCPGYCAKYWLNNERLNFGIIVSDSTGEIISNEEKAEINGLTFKIYNNNNNNYCVICGSLHKYKNKGIKNSDNFTFMELQDVLNEFEQIYNIPLNECIIQTMEIGVNIPLKYSPEIIIKSAICHRYKAFTAIYASKYSNCKKYVGKSAIYSSYEIKVYDKGKQINNLCNIIRIELKARRQRILSPYSVYYLSDLRDKNTLFKLLYLLLDAINGIIFFDFKVNCKTLSENNLLKFYRYSNPNYWEQMTNDARQKSRIRYNELLKKYDCIDWKKFVLNRTTEIWLDQLNLKAENRRLLPHLIEQKQAKNLASFATLDYLVTNVADSETKGDIKKENIKSIVAVNDKRIKITTRDKRYCVTCGRDITKQKSNSKFCSEKYFGKEAKKCRNKDSNRRLHIKRVIKSAISKNQLIKEEYYNNGVLCYEIVNPNIIIDSKDSIDKIINVSVIKR